LLIDIYPYHQRLNPIRGQSAYPYELKTLVVEYNEPYFGGIAPKWTSLKYSQWQSAIE